MPRDDLAFERPLGAHANVAELEYLQYLMDTTTTTSNDDNNNNNKTLGARDVSLLLRSKYGLNVEEEQVEAIMLHDFGGDVNDSDNDDSSSLDLCLITSMILAQHLLQISCFGDMEQVDQVFGIVFHKICKDVNGGLQQDNNNKNAARRRELDLSLIQQIVEEYQEAANISVQDMQEMLDCMGGEDVFTVDAFRCALVADLHPQLLLVPDDQHVSTHWQDVFYNNGDAKRRRRRIPVRPQENEEGVVVFPFGGGGDDSKQPIKAITSQHSSATNPFEDNSKAVNPFEDSTPHTSTSSSSNNNTNPFEASSHDDVESAPLPNNKSVAIHGGGEADNDSTTTPPPSRIPTLSSIDRVVESYPSQLFAITTLICVVVSYFSYLLDLDIGFGSVNCDNYASEPMCMIAAGIVNWLIIKVQLVLLGVPFILLVSMGMSMYYKEKTLRWNLVQLGMGMTSVVTFMILSVFFPIHEALLNDNEDNEIQSLNKWSHTASLTLGSLLLLFQFLQLLRMIMVDNDKKPTKNNKFVTWLVTPRMVHREHKSKQAATFKSKQFIHNALLLHEDNEPSAVALSNYFERDDSKETETVGTMKWFWNNRGHITTHEGIWFHTRILSSNLVQLFLILVIIGAMTAAVRYLDEQYEQSSSSLPSSTVTKASQQSWSLYIPNDIDPRFVTYLDWRYAFPLDELAFSKNQLERIQTNLGMQPLQWPVQDLGTWYMNRKALYFYNNQTTTEFVENRSLVPYTEEVVRTNLMAVLNTIHGTTATPNIIYNSTLSPGQQVIAMGLTGLCQDNTEVYYNASLGQTCATKATFLFDTLLRQLGDWGVDETVLLATATKDTLVANALQSLGETVERQEAVTGIIAGGVAGILAVLATSILYLPSYVVCVLKLRSGVIPIDRTFTSKYKTHTEEASVLFGSALWGCALSAGISGGVVGSLAFLTVWKESRSVMLAIFGNLVGWTVAIAIKYLFLLLIRGLYNQALYRDRPGASNVVNLALECWHIALAAGYMILQAIVLLTRTTIAIGHADTALPSAFTKDLMVAEAHRHPLIQRLSVFYLTKLRHGSKFCTRGGSCWRLIYVLVLMPWLKKYRPGFENYNMGIEAAAASDEKADSSTTDLDRLVLSLEKQMFTNDRLRAENEQYALQVKALKQSKRSVATVSEGVQTSPEPLKETVQMEDDWEKKTEAFLIPLASQQTEDQEADLQSRNNESMMVIPEQSLDDHHSTESATGWTSQDDSSFDSDFSSHSSSSSGNGNESLRSTGPPNPFKEARASDSSSDGRKHSSVSEPTV